MAKQSSTDTMPPVTTGALLRAIFLRKWVGVVSAAYALFGLLDVFDSKIVPKLPEGFKAVWDKYYFLGVFDFKTWVIIGLVIIIVVSLFGAYQFAQGYVRRYEQLTKHKVVFEIDEVSTRVFLQVTSEKSMLITARLKLRFENKDTNNWNMRNLNVAVHELKAPQEEEVPTFIIDDRYFGTNDVEIPREQFEGMTIQAGRLTPWYICTFSLSGVQGYLNEPSELTSMHCLKVTMKASNQKPLHARLFIDWERALKEQGAPILSYGPPAIRRWENRRLRD